MTTIEVIQKATELGLRLGSEDSDTLTFQPSGRCPGDFAETLKAHKCYLLVLLRLPFVMAYAKALGQTFFFAEDENTRAVLVEAGANSGSVYTRDELGTLLQTRRLFNAQLKGVTTSPVTPLKQRQEPAIAAQGQQAALQLGAATT
jgi:hypothetical protein